MEIFIWTLCISVIVWAIVYTYREYKWGHQLIKDPFYKKCGIAENDISLYQFILNKILELDSFNKAKCPSDIAKRDMQKIKSLLKETNSSQINENAIYMMLEQYTWSDIMFRDMNRHEWVKTVVSRRGIGNYPETLYLAKSNVKFAEFYFE